MVRGRAWIPLLGVLLAGIVAMQVEVLKLSATMGRALERGTALQSRNDQLRASVASLSDAERIERLAVAQGMVMPAPVAVTFLARHANGNVDQAVARLQAPDATGFMASLPVADTTVGASAGSSAAASTIAATVSPGVGSTSTAPAVPATGSGAPASASGVPATGTGTPAAASGAPGAGSGAPGATSGTPAANAGGTAPAVAPAAPTGQGATGQPASSTGAAALATGG
jgi:cell division protein FtsL